MKAENEIQSLLKMVLQGRMKIQGLELDIEQIKKTHRHIKEMNDERIRKIQNENRELDSELGVKEATFNKTKSEIETQFCEARAKLLRRITLCNLKNLLNDLKATTPEDAMTTIYTGHFVTVYDEITIGSKPVNMYEWVVRIGLAEQPKLRDLLPQVWPTFREIHWGYQDERAQFYQRDFKSEEKAKAYAERNRAKVCQELVSGIKQVEQEIEMANSDIDEVFDFRLLIDSEFRTAYSRSETFRVVSVEKHQLILSPVLSSYDKEVEKLQPYTIMVTQQGYQLTIAGHRFASQARQIKYAIYKYFSTEFKAIEADTKQEIQNPF